MEFYVIFHNTLDFPGIYVVRRQVSGPDGVWKDPRAGTAATLEEARRLVPPGLYRQDRQPDDSPGIVEVWF